MQGDRLDSLTCSNLGAVAANSKVPDDLRSALAAQPAAEAAWGTLTDIGRRDFVLWINEAKQPQTREKRIRVCCDKLVKGMRRPCCFAVVPMDLYRALGDSPEAKENWTRLTADEKRDFSDWIECAAGKPDRKARVVHACELLIAGARSPA